MTETMFKRFFPATGRSAHRLRDAAAAGFGCLLLAFGVNAAGAEQVVVTAKRLDGAVEVHTRAVLKASLASIWQTLTDYDHFSVFIPGMTSSQVIERRDRIAVVKQSGYAHMWIFSYPINVVVEALEKPPFEIRVHLLTGNIKRLEGSYRIEKIAGKDDEYALGWDGVIEPDFVLTSIAAPVIRANVSEQFLGMVAEIERRESLRAQRQPASPSPASIASEALVR